MSKGKSPEKSGTDSAYVGGYRKGRTTKERKFGKLKRKIKSRGRQFAGRKRKELSNKLKQEFGLDGS